MLSNSMLRTYGTPRAMAPVNSQGTEITTGFQIGENISSEDKVLGLFLHHLRSKLTSLQSSLACASLSYRKNVVLRYDWFQMAKSLLCVTGRLCHNKKVFCKAGPNMLKKEFSPLWIWAKPHPTLWRSRLHLQE